MQLLPTAPPRIIQSLISCCSAQPMCFYLSLIKTLMRTNTIIRSIIFEISTEIHPSLLQSQKQSISTSLILLYFNKTFFLHNVTIYVTTLDRKFVKSTIHEKMVGGRTLLCTQWVFNVCII